MMAPLTSHMSTGLRMTVKLSLRDGIARSFSIALPPIETRFGSPGQNNNLILPTFRQPTRERTPRLRTCSMVRWIRMQTMTAPRSSQKIVCGLYEDTAQLGR